MPKNVRICEKCIGQNEAGHDVWDNVEDITTLEPGDLIRIFEDKASKTDNIVLLQGYVTRKPWKDKESGLVTEINIESVNERKKREEQEKFNKLNTHLKEEN